MKRLSKEKRNHLVLAVLVSLITVSVLYFVLIGYQQENLELLVTQKESTDKSLNQISDTRKNSVQIEADLVTFSETLRKEEKEMASDDLYVWMLTAMRNFNKAEYSIDIKTTSSKGATEVNLLPKFPYKQFTISIAGSGYFHDIGKFIADYENKFPTSRVMNLDLFPEGSDEKLRFTLDITSLIRPTAQ